MFRYIYIYIYNIIASERQKGNDEYKYNVIF